MNAEVLIYPGVRALVAKLASMAALAASLCALGAAGELLLSPLGYGGAALIAGSVSELMMALLLSLVLWLAIWCHVVLLAGRGLAFTFYCLVAVAIPALLMPVCMMYLLMSGKVLLLRQADLPLICTSLLLLSVFLNMPRAVAAGWAKLTMISLFALMSFLYALTNVPALVWLNDIFKLAACGAIWYPLHVLSRYALRVVSLPPTEEK